MTLKYRAQDVWTLFINNFYEQPTLFFVFLFFFKKREWKHGSLFMSITGTWK